MVYYKMAGRVHYFTVHPDIFSFFPGAGTTDGIVSITPFGGVPFVLIQSLEIFRIDDGVFSLGKRYPAERIAVACPAVKQHQGNKETPQPVRNCYRDGKVELNTTLRSVEILNSKI